MSDVNPAIAAMKYAVDAIDSIAEQVSIPKGTIAHEQLREVVALADKAESLRAQLSEAQARNERLREDVHTAWSAERECRERLASRATAGQHADDVAVDRFAEAMKAKMAASRANGRGGWESAEVCPPGSLQQMLLDHLAKGDPVDVGNFAMMIFNRGESTAAAQPVDDDRCLHGIRYPHPCRECEESVPGSTRVCEACGGHGCSQCEGGFVNTAPVSPAAQAGRAAAVEQAAAPAEKVSGPDTARTIRHNGVVMRGDCECTMCKRYNHVEG